ncbi:MAG: class I SAM-dependent methyltransferase [Anaerolineae bacterium]|nr:class I SAM-dependent methyltransferase [Anaerolineae bacterium]
MSDTSAQGNANQAYYDLLAEKYHLFYRDWEAQLAREGMRLKRWFRDREVKTVLDASCGPGTQAVALAQIGYWVLASDPSPKMIERARKHAEESGVSDRITFLQAGFLDIARMTNGNLDVILTKGDAFPHLITDTEIEETLAGFYRLLRPGGIVLIGMRDFEPYLQDRPRFLPGRVHDPEDHGGQQTIVFETWDWHEGPPLTVTLNKFILTQEGERYNVQVFPIQNRALTAAEVQVVMLEAGFEDIEISHDRAELVMIGTKPMAAPEIRTFVRRG